MSQDLSITKLIRRYGFCRKTWQRWLQQGKFPHAKQYGAGVLTLIPVGDVKLFLRARRRASQHGRAGAPPSMFAALNGRSLE
jgi:hypothetical protein